MLNTNYPRKITLYFVLQSFLLFCKQSFQRKFFLHSFRRIRKKIIVLKRNIFTRKESSEQEQDCLIVQKKNNILQVIFQFDHKKRVE